MFFDILVVLLVYCNMVSLFRVIEGCLNVGSVLFSFIVCVNEIVLLRFGVVLGFKSFVVDVVIMVLILVLFFMLVNLGSKLFRIIRVFVLLLVNWCFILCLV